MTPIVSDREPANPTTKRIVRPEIQALRAIAVSLVVVYHLFPNRLPGGYIGVDVFFAISGFLMTSHIFGQIRRDGRVSFRKFYARRIRRLLPASMAVVLVIGIATLVVVPVRLWTTIGQHLIASALYVENWALVANSVDYLGASSTVIPTQHFWSLAVEEQFYLVWPILLTIAAVVLARGDAARRTRAVGIVIVVIGILSLAYSIWATNYDQASSYFNTFTRFWEFALGGIAAIVLPRIAIGPKLSSALSWIGLLAIAGTSLVFRDSSPFPGWIAAFPVLATLLVIAGGDSSARFSPAPLFRFRPVQFVGDISYSIYLWHWPLIVLLPLASASRLSTTMKVGIIAGSLLLGYLSKRFIEDPLRADRASFSSAQPVRLPIARVFVAALASMVIVSAVGVTVLSVGQSRVDAAERTLASLPAPSTLECFGASALPQISCRGSNGLGNGIYPPPIIAREETGSQGCQQTSLDTTLLSCRFGSKSASALKVALVGDSHAGEWLGALRGVAKDTGWSVTTFLRSGCGLSVTSTPSIGSDSRCIVWNNAVMRALIANRFDLVIVSTRSSLVGGGAMTAAEQSVVSTGMARSWAQLTAAGIQVIAIRDTPEPLGAGVADVPACVADSREPEASCSVAKAKALIVDPQVAAAAKVPAVHVVDLTKYFCPTTQCPAIIGNVLVYGDGHHMTGLYSQTLAPALGRALTAALRIGS